MELNELIERVKNKIPNDPQQQSEDGVLETAESTLRGQFSKDFSRNIVSDIIGTGDFDYPLPIPSSKEWQKDFSVINLIEYPAGERFPVVIDSKDYIIQNVDTLFHGTVTDGPFTLGETITGGTSGATATVTVALINSIEYTLISGTLVTSETITGANSGATTVLSNVVNQKIHFFHHTPSTSEIIRISYNIAYLNSTISNIPDREQEALVLLTAAHCAEYLARFYAQSSDGSIDIDTVDYGEKSQIWQDRSSDLKKQYKALTNIDNGIKATSITHTWETRTQRRQPWMTHKFSPFFSNR